MLAKLEEISQLDSAAAASPTRLYFSNVSYKTTEADIKELLAEFEV